MRSRRGRGLVPVASARTPTGRHVPGREPYLLGLDIGTTTCRAVVTDSFGRVAAQAATEVPVHSPAPLAAEVDPDDWWRCVVHVVGDAVNQGCLYAEKIRAVGLSGLMHAPVLLDDGGRPLAEAPLWMDQRCQTQAVELADLARTAGAPWADVRTSVTAAKLRWWSQVNPGLLTRARTLLLPKDYVRYRLTGIAATDPSDAAGTGLLNAVGTQWHDGLAANAGVSRSILPPIRASDQRAGGVTAAAAAVTGLAEGTPVAVGAADTVCTRLGVGRLPPGTVLTYLGTAAWIAIAEGVDANGYPLARDAGATTATGSALRWLRELLADGGLEADGYNELGRSAAAVPPGSAGAVFLPHLMGERGPVNDPAARGVWTGLTLHHRAGHLVRSVMEGTAYQLRRLYDAARLSESTPVLCCGGVCRSATWMGILADVTGRALRVVRNVEASALGAVILAARSSGVTGVDASPTWNPVARTIEPAPERRALYEELYREYCRIDATASGHG